MFQRIRCVLIKEFKQIFRDPRMKTIIFISPLIQVLVFGYAATTDVKNIPTAIYDLDNTFESRELLRAFTYSKYFSVKYALYSDKQQKEIIDKSLVNAVIRINRGFARNLRACNLAHLQLIVDGTDSNTAVIVLSYAQKIIRRYSNSPQIELKTRAWFNENLESRNFYIPGVIALLVTLTSLLLTAMAIVREKEIGTIEQLIVSPIRPIELILGKMLPFALISLTDLIFITALGVIWFEIPIRGNIFFLLCATVIYLLTSLGAGLFISTVSSTQHEASMSVFLFFFPVNLLSGFVFPIANMPKVIQYITYFNPLRYYLVILRGIFLKGIGLRILWPELLILLFMGISITTLSSLRFQKRLV